MEEHLTFWQIRDLDLWILRSGEMSGCLAGIFTNHGGDHTLSKMPQDYLEGCCGGYAGQTRAQNERTDHAVPKNGFWNTFFVKSMRF